MSFRGNRFLVNEKSLEINTTCELMSSLGIGAIGFTGKQEFELGADVYLPIGRPLILQYKRAYHGRDFIEATSDINNNSNRTQHRTLDALSRSGLCDAFYVFPLIVHNRQFVQSFGRLSDVSVFVVPSQITDSVANKPFDWMDEIHSITVNRSMEFIVSSSGEGLGQGISKEELLKKIHFNLESKRDERLEETLTEHIERTIEQMERTLKGAQIPHRSEHTLTLFLKSIENGTTHYVSLPVQLRGVTKSNRESSETTCT